ncbi:hypothetical protein [Longimicrobium sp.]|uniref:hypothetical protein n=1 Tax=Longimicrobium sp. TaxID=2029185 RepID=UPI003B3AFCA3
MAMMDELVQQIATRANLPPDKAMQAARTAIEFLDGKLPPPVGGNLHRLLGEGGGEGGGPDVGDIAGKLGGLFGR